MSALCSRFDRDFWFAEPGSTTLMTRYDSYGRTVVLFALAWAAVAVIGWLW